MRDGGGGVGAELLAKPIRLLCPHDTGVGRRAVAQVVFPGLQGRRGDRR